MFNDDYYCVLSGVSPKNIGEDEGDDFADLPNGWLKITIQRRYENEDWIHVQEIKKAAVGQMLSQIPEQDRELVKRSIELQVDAQYCVLEEKIGRYIVDEEVRYICDPTDSEELLTETQKLFEMIELDMEDFAIENEVEEAEVKSPQIENKEEVKEEVPQQEEIEQSAK